jgi:hypothetical protein
MNTTENNKLIADFMELKPIFISPDFYGIQKDHVHITGKNTDFVMFEFSKSAKYHSDWNWLMEVVEKIESLNYTVSIRNHICRIEMLLLEDIVISEDIPKIQAVYNTCVEFIKWYSADKKASEVKTVKLQFRGIDNWGRPVYKDVDSKRHYGSVDKLYSENYLSENKIEKVKGINDFFRENIDMLEFFGIHFGCEPNGGMPANVKLVILG